MRQILSEQEIQTRAKEITRYQNFKTDVALQKMSCTMPKLTFDAGVTYLKRGQIVKSGASKRLIQELDKCLENHIQPLTPTPSERRLLKNKIYQKKHIKPPVCKLVEKPVSSNFNYGIKIGDCIKVVNSEKEARAFIRGMRFIEPHAEAVLVQVELNIMED